MLKYKRLFIKFAILGMNLMPIILWSQADKPKPKALSDDAKIEWYKYFTLERDSTAVDTSLTLQDEYQHNYLRKDLFGLLPFANEGQAYTNLRGISAQAQRLPELGYSAKHWFYQKADQMRYYQVPTPFTDLYYKSVMEQGQSLDALITFNTHKRLNWSIAYKGMRSNGKYINQIVSNGNLRATVAYLSPKGQYDLKAHLTSQDTQQGENGGITTPDNFESGESLYSERARLQVYFVDAKSIFEGKRWFADQTLDIWKIHNFKTQLHHTGSYETKRYEYLQPTLASTVGSTSILRYGSALVSGNINDQMHMNSLYNKLGVQWQHPNLGQLGAYVEDYRYNYYFTRVIQTATQIIPSSLNESFQSIIGNYSVRHSRWELNVQASQALRQALTHLDAKARFAYAKNQWLNTRFQALTRWPSMQAQLQQSSYLAYNWRQNFSTEKMTFIEANIETPWATLAFKNSTFKDYIYWSNDASSSSGQLLVSPKQYGGGAISYTGIEANKSFTVFRRWTSDTRVLFQKVIQPDPILNVPDWVIRQTISYQNVFFQRALQLQIGVTGNYFTTYYANGYLPLLGEYYVQTDKKIGGFPLLDLFVNARIRQARIFIKAEHLNSGYSGYQYYTAPGYPYRDFMIRFGVEWNFFE